MDIRIERKNTRNLYETPLLHQTSFWSEVKHQQGFETQAFDIKVRESDISQDAPKAAYLVDDILILIQNIGRNAKIGYVPYGPALRPSDACKGPFLEELSESLRSYLSPSCIMLRYDLPWESLWAKEEENYTEDGEWVGPPSQSLQELRMNYGTSTWNLKKAGTDILPPDTAILDLKTDLEILQKSMKPKTRYNINLAKKKHVVVRKGSFADLDIFYELYRQTCFRNQINLHGSSYFEAMFTNDLHKKELDDSDTDFELLIAEVDSMPLSAMFLTYSSTRATYLFGASSSENRNFMSTYLLQWEAIQRAKLRGCIEYDLFGTAPKADPGHPMYGLYRFKMGFGGKQLHRMGCWDFPLQKENYRHYLTNEMVGKGYHLR